MLFMYNSLWLSWNRNPRQDVAAKYGALAGGITLPPQPMNAHCMDAVLM
jgi:hypothetical protein